MTESLKQRHRTSSRSSASPPHSTSKSKTGAPTTPNGKSYASVAGGRSVLVAPSTGSGAGIARDGSGSEIANGAKWHVASAKDGSLGRSGEAGSHEVDDAIDKGSESGGGGGRNDVLNKTEMSKLSAKISLPKSDPSAVKSPTTAFAANAPSSTLIASPPPTPKETSTASITLLEPASAVSASTAPASVAASFGKRATATNVVKSIRGGNKNAADTTKPVNYAGSSTFYVSSS